MQIYVLCVLVAFLALKNETIGNPKGERNYCSFRLDQMYLNDYGIVNE